MDWSSGEAMSPMAQDRAVGSGGDVEETLAGNPYPGQADAEFREMIFTYTGGDAGIAIG